MGKRLRAQRLGRGSRTYRIAPRTFKFRPEYRKQPGFVIDIIHDRGRKIPLAKIKYADKTKGFMVAKEGIKIGDKVEKFVLPLYKIPESTPIFAIETKPNSGPKLCRTPGSFALIVSKGKKSCVIQLPSKKTKSLNPECLATIGIPAGGGRIEKPWVKAGQKWIAMHALGKLYPRTSGVAMNPVDHPFGGQTKPGKSISVSRHAPPGRKVGSISPKRMGRKKKD